MSYKIVIDSCGELPEYLKKDEHFETIPMELFLDGEAFADDETFAQGYFLQKVAASPNCPKSACSSPERYMRAYDCRAQRVYVVTLSARLSGSYNSARLGRELYLEDNRAKDIHVFDSKSASVGETLIALKIKECEEAGMSFEEVIAAVDDYIAGQDTYFVLETLDALRKNGRLSNLKAFVATALKIKPIMGSTPDGDICQLDQTLGMNKAIDRMVALMLGKVQNCETKVLAIAHCNCPQRAQKLMEKIKEKANFKEVFIVDTAGISTLYAGNGGIIMVV